MPESAAAGWVGTESVVGRAEPVLRLCAAWCTAEVLLGAVLLCWSAVLWMCGGAGGAGVGVLQVFAVLANCGAVEVRVGMELELTSLSLTSLSEELLQSACCGELSGLEQGVHVDGVTDAGMDVQPGRIANADKVGPLPGLSL